MIVTQTQMARRAITFVVLFAVAAWAELCVAPMLTMVAHVHPTHAAAANKMDHAAMHHGMHHGGADAAEKPCCPGLHGTISDKGLTIAAEAPGCEDSHRCCFRQGPQSVPSPVRDVERQGQSTESVVIAAMVLPQQAMERAPSMSAGMAARPPDLFAMTFRV